MLQEREWRMSRKLLPNQTRRTLISGDMEWDTISGPCAITGQDWSIEVLGAELNEWLSSDKLIQDCLSCDEDAREFLMTGISPAGWDIMFPPIVGEEDE